VRLQLHLGAQLHDAVGRDVEEGGGRAGIAAHGDEEGRGLSAEQVYWTPYAYLHPDPVSFPSPDPLQATTLVARSEDGEERRTVEFPWKE